MILKEKDAYTGGDERGFYGHKQEQDVAFHLRRAFGDSKQVRIIHNPLSCKQCGEAHNLTGMYGQYGYYVKCDRCHTNTSMKQPAWPAAGRAFRLPRRGRATRRPAGDAITSTWFFGRGRGYVSLHPKRASWQMLSKVNKCVSAKCFSAGTPKQASSGHALG